MAEEFHNSTAAAIAEIVPTTPLVPSASTKNTPPKIQTYNQTTTAPTHQMSNTNENERGKIATHAKMTDSPPRKRQTAASRF